MVSTNIKITVVREGILSEEDVFLKPFSLKFLFRNQSEEAFQYDFLKHLKSLSRTSLQNVQNK